jgi:hypothetical protein
MMFRRRFLLLGFAACLLISPAPTTSGGRDNRIWRLAEARLEPALLSANLEPLVPSEVIDFDGDGRPETLSLVNGQALIQTGKQIRWESPQAWQVRQVQIADLNHDSQPEAVLLVWRTFQPWPIDAWLPHGGRIDQFHNSDGMSCHLILIGWLKRSFGERWAGSALAQPVTTFAAADLTGSGKQFLVTLEAEYDDPPSVPARNLKVWEWNGFGFTVVSQEPGAFNQLVIARAGNGQLLILVP